MTGQPGCAGKAQLQQGLQQKQHTHLYRHRRRRLKACLHKSLQTQLWQHQHRQFSASCSSYSSHGRDSIDQSPSLQQLQHEQLAGSHSSAAAQRRALWMRAIKPPMYSVGYIPVLVGAAAVFLETGTVPFSRILGLLAAAISIIAWLNLSNDAFDAATGVDATKPESVVNLTGNRPLVFWLSVAFLVMGVSLLGHFISSTGDMRVATMLALSIACGYMYQGPPFRLSYKGLGEPLCFLAFGPSATPAFYLALQPAASQVTAGVAATAAATAAAAAAQLPPISSLVWGLSLLVGASTTTILFTSHFHQIDGDRAAGKRSPLVRLGVERGVSVLTASVVGVYLVAAALAACGALPALVLGPVLVLSLGPAKNLVDYAVTHKQDPPRLALLKRFACMWHITLGCSLVLGLAVARFCRL